MAAPSDAYDITWCDWANDERLLCGVRFIASIADRSENSSAQTRLVAVNADGSEFLPLLDGFRFQYQDFVIDWLPDDPEHVMLGMLHRVIKVDIHEPAVDYGFGVTELASRSGAHPWISDGYGVIRLYARTAPMYRSWYVIEDGAPSLLHRDRLGDGEDEFSPIGYDRDANEVLFLGRHEGRRAVFARAPDDDAPSRLVYAHPRADVDDVYRMGRYSRIVGAVVIEDRPTLHFFDPELQRVQAMLEAEFPGMTVNVLDSDWAGRRYLVLVSSDRDAGTYYVFDSEIPELIRFTRAFPSLGDRELSAAQPVSYRAGDGAEIRAYLTLPPGRAPRGGILLPNGGPFTHDYWRFDGLVQFLAARGYAILARNYRDVPSYGDEWHDGGGFQSWRRTVDDIAAGARYLVEAGFAERDRLCVVGWSFGGYAALLSAIEYRELYRCVVSIAGITDPASFGGQAFFVGGRRRQSFIDIGDARHHGSALRRADEIVLPTLLFHAWNDFAVPFGQAADLRDAIRSARGDVELIEYEHAEHNIWPPTYRIDMLTRLGDFLDTRLDQATPDFYSSTAPAGVVEIVDFGIDSGEPNGICGDARFAAADGGLLRDRDHPMRVTRDDATDCRRQFLDGEIVLRDSVAPNRAGNAIRDPATIFIEPSQQGDVEIASLDGDALSGVPVVYVRPGYRVLGVQARGFEYGCVLRIGETDAIAEDPVYFTEQAGRDRQAALVRIPAFAGRYYRVRASVVNDSLTLHVADTSGDRTIVDQRRLTTEGCNGSMTRR